MGSSEYMSKYWREYRAARKRGLSPSKARREASKIGTIWYHWIRMSNEL